MQVIFFDESGYSKNWEKDIDNQPYYVLSAVCFPFEKLLHMYQEIRNKVSNLNLPNAKPLGQGFEIKARDVANSSGFWNTNENNRDEILDIMLTAPKKYGGTAIVVVINKLAHKEKYTDPYNPSQLSFRYSLERMQRYLSDIDDYGVCIYDLNDNLKNSLQEDAAYFKRVGSEISYFSSYYEWFVTKTKVIDRIIELSFAQSEYSIGLQVADFFVTITNTHEKNRKKLPCDCWDKLQSSLYKKDGKIEGIGYKKFPPDSKDTKGSFLE